MIMSVKRDEKCEYGRKEHFSCPHLNCNLCVCKRYADEKDDTIVRFLNEYEKYEVDGAGEEEE